MIPYAIITILWILGAVYIVWVNTLIFKSSPSKAEAITVFMIWPFAVLYGLIRSRNG